jgi:hypothetical protein
MTIPAWLHLLSIAALALGLGCALVVAIDVARHPQRMAIMNIVWPVAALFGTLIWLWGYFRYGRRASKPPGAGAGPPHGTGAHASPTPFPIAVAQGASHCGSGCMLGDLIAEWLAFLWPGVLVIFGWGSLFHERMFAAWVLDYLFAFAIGIVFQYFSIAPMRHLGLMQGLWAALKADTLSLTAWQVGMYGFMAWAQLGLFRRGYGAPLAVNTPEFWFIMQIAMLCGFVTAYPVNWWLIRAGWKERM